MDDATLLLEDLKYSIKKNENNAYKLRLNDFLIDYFRRFYTWDSFYSKINLIILQ